MVMMWIKIILVLIPVLTMTVQYGIIQYKNNEIENLNIKIEEKNKKIKDLNEIIDRLKLSLEGAKKDAQKSAQRTRVYNKKRVEIRKQADQKQPVSPVIRNTIDSLYLESKE